MKGEIRGPQKRLTMMPQTPVTTRQAIDQMRQHQTSTPQLKGGLKHPITREKLPKEAEVPNCKPLAPLLERDPTFLYQPTEAVHGGPQAASLQCKKQSKRPNQAVVFSQTRSRQAFTHHMPNSGPSHGHSKSYSAYRLPESTSPTQPDQMVKHTSSSALSTERL